MNKIRILPFIIMMILLSACTYDVLGPPLQTSTAGQQIVLNFSEKKSFEGFNGWVEFSELQEDSRCPIGAICVWEGRAVVGLNLLIEGSSEKMVLIKHEGHEELASDTTANHVFTLLEVNPHPEIDKEYTADDYQIVIRVL